MFKMKHDYKAQGFKCGLEIHQQLSGEKLFCGCPALIKKGTPDFVFERKLRASAGETGKVDLAALHEHGKKKSFEYQGYFDTCCLVEMDEEPPHPVNREALEAALVMAKLLNMKIVDGIQFMRKTVIDGSNVSGFQRTALIGYDGFVEVNGRKIRVDSLCLEEEAAQVVKRGKDKDSYNISRLGIPLLEIATAPDIMSPDECREVAGHIGMLLRSTGRVMRGIGSIRQDVNISIKGGARTEIKGFQDYKNIPKVVDYEIERQLKLIKDKKKVEESVRKAEPNHTTSYLRPMPGADRMYPETDVEVIIPGRVELDVPETLEEKKSKLVKKHGLSEDLARLALRFEEKNDYSFEKDFKKYSSKSLSPTTMADIVLIKAPGVAKKESKDFDVLKVKDVLFSELSNGKIALSAVNDVLKEFAVKGKVDFKKYELLIDSETEKIVKKIISENKGAPRGLVMGKVMQELKGRADGKKVNELVSKHLK